MNTNTLPATAQMKTGPTSRMRTKQAAEYIGYEEQTMRAMRHYGTGPRSYKIGRFVWYDIADLDAWIAAQKARTSVGGIA